MQFLVNAWDHTDEDAINRRMARRDAHLAGVKKLIADGHFISGGASLDDDGKMIGSSLHLEFPDRESLDACLLADPYVAGRVWDKIKVHPVRLVQTS